jgi:hypothetical protein
MASQILIASLALLLSGQSEFDRAAYSILRAKVEAQAAAGGASDTDATPPAGFAPTGSGRASLSAAPGCLLLSGAVSSATTRQCTACHANEGSGHSHPIDVPQEGGRSRMLRSAAEVVKRGVFLQDGMVTCLSCHDGNSKWKYKIALPSGSQVRSRVVAGRTETYESPVVPVSIGVGVPGGPVTVSTYPAGSDVSPTPLCKACHAFD